MSGATMLSGIAPEPVLEWAALLIACALPFLLGLVAVVQQQRLNHRRRGAWLPEAAGPWLEQQIRRLHLPVRVEVHPRDGLDAYWPSVGAIGLSERTWGGCRPGDWAIAAHELGHAMNMASHPLVAQMLPTARLAQALAWRAFAAALLSAVLLDEPLLLPLALGFLGLSVVVSSVVCLDEASASWRGYHLLLGDKRFRREARDVARESMIGAGSVYGLGLLGQIAVLAAWSPLARLAVSGSRATPGEPTVAAIWLTVVLVPLLLLRAAHVLTQVLAPEPVTTDFRLFTVMHREGQWEFLTGIGVLIVAVGLHSLVDGPLDALAMVLGTTTAIGPVGGLARALVLFPLLLLARRWLERQEEDDDAFFPSVACPDEAAPALMALYSDPPWYLRVSWLAHLAYLPLLGVLLLRLLA